MRCRFIHERPDHCVVALRTNDFPVQVYEDMVIRLVQQEADRSKTLAAQGQDPVSLTQQHIKELQKLLKP